MLALLAGVGKLLADVRRVGNCFATYIEDDVADLQAVIGGDAVRVDGGDDNAAAFGTRAELKARRSVDRGVA